MADPVLDQRQNKNSHSFASFVDGADDLGGGQAVTIIPPAFLQSFCDLSSDDSIAFLSPLLVVCSP